MSLLNWKAEEESALRAKAREKGVNLHGQSFRYHSQKFGLYTVDSGEALMGCRKENNKIRCFLKSSL